MGNMAGIGEFWKFNDRVSSIQAYGDKNGEEIIKNKSMACRGGNANYFRTVKIIEVASEGRMIKIQGTQLHLGTHFGSSNCIKRRARVARRARASHGARVVAHRFVR